MNCWHCGSNMIWGSDYDFETYGLDGEGIVSTFSCSKCPATAEVFLPLDNAKEKKDE